MIGVVLVLLVVALSVRGEQCDGCTGDGCKVLDTVKVTKLCADELCVGGASVVVGDGDPCTSDDTVDGVAVHLPIKNCCASKQDCDRWAPAPNCVMAECVFTEEVTTHGWCEFSAVPNCCADAKDCPAQPCKSATCERTEAGSLHFSEQHKRFVELAPHQLDNIPGQCSYSERDDACCLTTRDCAGKCRPGEFGICDKGMTCQCVPSNANECAKDQDCAADEPARRTCEEGCDDATKPPCFFYDCDRGWCTCVFDPDRDSDGDGVCCKDDCDDRDVDAQSKILCPVGPLVGIDADGDGFYKCLIEVQATCEPTCANGAAPVSATDVQEVNGKLVLTFGCDCCDDNSGGLDQPLTCAKDANGFNGTAPSVDCEFPPFTCSRCYESLCVLQGDSGKVPSTDTAALNALCAEVTDDDDYVYYPVPADAPATPQCDYCDQFDNAQSLTPTLMCPAEYDAADTTWSICQKSALGQEYGPAMMAECCEFILEIFATGPAVPDNLADYQACCRTLKALDPPYSAACGECGANAPDNSEFPGTCERCECDNEWGSPCSPGANSDDEIIQCVVDSDGDQFYDCKDRKQICYPASADQSLTYVEICQNEFGLSATSYEDAMQGVTDGFDGTYCDCDDTLPAVFQEIACGVDNDGDGNVVCTQATCSDGVYVPQSPVCTKVCAATCEAPKVEITQSNCDPVVQAPERRRSVAIAQVVEAAERNGWFNGGGAGAKSKDELRKRDDRPMPRKDSPCDGLLCNKCDCCDDDSFVFHGSNIATAVINQCWHHDMNCDCMYHSTVACSGAVSVETKPNYYQFTLQPDVSAPSDAVDFSVGIRNLGNATATKYLSGSRGATPDRLGYCGDDCDQMCMDYIPGISLESKLGGPANRKRALTIELQKSCTKLVSLDETNLDANDNVLTLLPGDCFEFIEACGTPCNREGECNADCEICTKLWS